jgi:RNA polymerase sigma factor (sigma-70 family)
MTERSVIGTAGMTIAGVLRDDAGVADRAVIRASVADPERFAVIFRRHAQEIHRYATRRLGADADDVVAETFLTAFRQRSRYDPAYPDARPWLYGIATNLIGCHRRAEVRRYRALARAGAAGTQDSAEPFADRVDDTVTAGAAGPQLAAALAKLPVSSRDALLLVAWGGLTYEQAATALGVPAGTFRSRISRARARLRRLLADAGLDILSDKEHRS